MKFLYDWIKYVHANVRSTNRLPYSCLHCIPNMKTSSNGNIFSVTRLLCGEFTDHGEFPAQRSVTRRFDVFFDLRLNQQLSKQWRRRWFETPSHSSWHHCNEKQVLCLQNNNIRIFRRHWRLRFWADNIHDGNQSEICLTDFEWIIYICLWSPWAGETQGTAQNLISNSNFLKFCSFLAPISVVKSVQNFARSTRVIWLHFVKKI